MPNTSKRKLKIFKVAYKCYYHELSDWAHDHIRAKDKENALRVFASRHRINIQQEEKPENWRWWDGDWYMCFCRIDEMEQMPKLCPHCQGTGKILAGRI
jgi:regulation of enolase protein 1 (concanavalin A-like superfamily)